MKILAFLQNAWFKPSTVHLIQSRPERYNREVIWKYAFYHSRSGKRLRAGLGEDLFDQIVWDNASPQLGTVSSSKFPADHHHIQGVLARVQPEVVIAMGGVAEGALQTLWPGRLICMPHPANRILTNELLIGLRCILNGNAQHQYRVALRQQRGHYTCDPLTKGTNG